MVEGCCLQMDSADDTSAIAIFVGTQTPKIPHFYFHVKLYSDFNFIFGIYGVYLEYYIDHIYHDLFHYHPS